MVAQLTMVEWLHQFSFDWNWLAVKQQDLSKIHDNPSQLQCYS